MNPRGPIRAFTRWSLGLMGLELRRRTEPLRFMAPLGIRTVIDVGSNKGQFAKRVRSILPLAELHMFEPIPHVCDRLREDFASDSASHCYQMAVGEQDGEVEFTVNEFSPSSSILPISAEHLKRFSFAVSTSKCRVPVRTLDGALSGVSLQRPILLKLDVQGFEDRVLRGAPRVLEQSSVIILEVNFVRLYDGQPSFAQLYEMLMPLGFSFGGMVDVYQDPLSGELIYGDAVFNRRAEGR